MAMDLNAALKNPKVLIGVAGGGIVLMMIMRARSQAKAGGMTDTPLQVMDPASAFQFSQNAWPYGDQAWNMFGGPIPVHNVDAHVANPPPPHAHHWWDDLAGLNIPIPGAGVPPPSPGLPSAAAAADATGAVGAGALAAPGHRKKHGGRGNQQVAGGGGASGAGGGRRGSAMGGVGKMAHPANLVGANNLANNHQMARSSAFGKPNVRSSAHPAAHPPAVNLQATHGGGGFGGRQMSASPPAPVAQPRRAAQQNSSGASQQSFNVSNPNAHIQGVANTGSAVRSGRRR